MKASAILVQLTAPLEALPPGERDVVSRFLFQHMRGLDRKHDIRWRRLWNRVVNGEVLQFYPVEDRNRAFHAMVIVTEERIHANQDAFPAGDVGRRWFRNWLKLGACHSKLQLVGAHPRWLPGSFAFEECSEDEAREYWAAAQDFLHTPGAQEFLWPRMSDAERIATLERLLAKPNPAERPATKEVK